AEVFGDEQGRVDQQDHHGGEPCVGDQAAQNLAGIAPLHRARTHRSLAIRAHFVASRHKRPAIGAHPPVVHCTHCTARSSADRIPLLQLEAWMPKTEEQYRQDILDVGKLIYQKGWVAANDGNISVRLDDRRILCTCTGVSKGMMTPADVIVCDLAGNKIDGARERTTEIAMHLTIYRMRPDVSAIVHAHPPVATGFAVAGRPLTM